MEFATVRANLDRVWERVSRVQAAEGVRNEVRVVAVTKGHPAGAIEAAHAAGLTDVGENRVQEAVRKHDEVTLPVRWHLIGHLQTNKAKFVPGVFSVVHSVDGGKVAEALARARARLPDPPPPVEVLVQVNVAGETQKTGCPPDEAAELVHRVAEMPDLRVRGLMTMAPFVRDETTQRRVFADLRRIRDQLVTDGLRLPDLSMGMSGDFEAAVAEGATMLRLGTVLFGERS